MKKQKILIIEDEAIIALNIQNMLETKGYEVCDIGKTADEAVRLTEKHNPDLILIDIILKGKKDGIIATQKITDDEIKKIKAFNLPKRLDYQHFTTDNEPLYILPAI